MKLLAPLFRKPSPPPKTAKPKRNRTPKARPIVCGIPATIKPVRGIDEKAQAKLVLKAGQPAELVMLTDVQDRAFHLEDCGDYWLVGPETRREVVIK